MSNPLLQADTASTQSLPHPGLVEKVSLERYVPPRKPSLVGLSRAELDHLRLLQNHQVPEIARKLGLTIDDLKEHIEIIRNLEAREPAFLMAIAPSTGARWMNWSNSCACSTGRTR